MDERVKSIADVVGLNITLGGEVPNPADPPSGCYFHPRYRYAVDLCRDAAPPFTEIDPGHYTACHFSGTLELNGVVY